MVRTLAVRFLIAILALIPVSERMAVAQAVPLEKAAAPAEPPELQSWMADTLAVDADGSAGVSAGDVLRYTVTVRNAGPGAATGVLFQVAPGRGTTLAAGSVQASQGSVLLGNGGDDATVTVAIGELRKGAAATVIYEVTLASRLPFGLDRIVSQGMVVADQVPAVLTDDPETAETADPVSTSLGNGPALAALKTAVILGDGVEAAPRGFLPGDHLLYTVTLVNRGRSPANGAVFTDPLGSNLRLVSGSVTAAQGSITRGNNPGDGKVAVEVGQIPAGGSVVVTYEAEVDPRIADAVTVIANQGLAISAENPAGIPTDDPTTEAVADPTVTPRKNRLLLSVSKTDLLLLDANGDGRPGPGDLLRYVVLLRNRGDAHLDGVVFLDTPGSGSALIVGSVRTSAGRVRRGNTAGDQGVEVELGSIKKRTGATVVFDVVVAATLPVGVGSLANQGSATASNLAAVLTDDPSTPAPGDPTATVLAVPATLGDFVWEDRDRDGLRDSDEPGISSVAVTLLDSSGRPLANTATDADGRYRFTGLDADRYAVAFAAPAGLTFSPRDQGGDDSRDSDVDPANGRTAFIDLAPAEVDLSVDAGLLPPNEGAIAGFVWNDLSGNGIQDSQEAGIPGVIVRLLDGTGAEVANASSDANGLYRFEHLESGSYSVAFVPPLGFDVSPQDQGGDDARDSDVDPATRHTGTITLSGGEQALDAGLFQPITSLASSPAHGETAVAVTRETILRFSNALAASAVIDGSKLFAEFGGHRLGARIHLAPDRETVTLFYNEPLPPSARVRVTFVGDGVPNRFGNDVDGDGDGSPGGTAIIDFDTLSLTTLANTRVCGRVFASELVPGDSGSSVNEPLEGVTISVDGREETLRTVTDNLGNFCLSPAPVGRFFVHVDGRTAIRQVPPGAYYPVVGKAWESTPRGEVNVGSIFLPLVPADALKPVSQTSDTLVTFPPSVLADFPEFAGVQITVPADSLYADDGTRGGKVGIAPVPPDRIPGPLPPGLEFPVVITVQTDGASNFDVPIPACFPNMADPSTGAPLAPGEKNGLFSFNHDTGQWDYVGPMTVTADGHLICTDPGVGILAPGWHGSGPPPKSPPPPPKKKPYLPCPEPNDTERFNKCLENAKATAQLCQKNCLYWLSACATIQVLVCGPAIVVTALCLFDCEEQFFRQIKECKDNYCAGGPSSLSSLFTAAFDRGTSEQIAQLIREATDLLYPYTIRSIPAPPDLQAQVDSLLAQATVLAGGDLQAYLNRSALAKDLENALLDQEVGSARFDAPPYSVRYAAQIQRPSGQLVLRGSTGPSGQYVLFIPRDGVLQYVSFYDSRTKSYGVLTPHVRPNVQYDLPHLSLGPIDTSFTDFDHDGLPDLVEFVYGTDPADQDSDGDGVFDGPEVDQGTNPLDGRPTQTGIIATADTPGTAVDVCAINDVAVVADTSAGVSVFNVFNGMEPTIVAQVDTPGAAQAVACAGSLVALADGAAGLAVIDVSDPPAAKILYQVPLDGSATAVAVAGNVAYVGLATGQIAVVDLLSGALLDQVFIGNAIQDVVINGDTLYVLTVGSLYALPLFDGDLRISGSASSPGSIGAGGRRFRLFAGGGIAYSVHTSGYNTFSLADPARPTLIAAGSTSQAGWKQIVANGSGLGVAAVGNNSTPDGPHDVSLYDVRDPRATNAFLTQFETPGLAAAVSIYNGLAYVADSESGLQVINYLPYDALRVPPTIALSTNFAPGIAEEGKVMRLTATVGDDVQVRNVEFYVDGVKVATDGNFPFEYRFVTPLRSVQPSLTLRARASDTGGNTTWSEELLIVLTADATAPRVVAVTPRSGVSVEEGTALAVSATFSEPIDSATLSASSFQLYSAGPDGITGTADDQPVIPRGVVSYRSETNTAFLTYKSPLPIGLYRAEIGGAVADLAGNTLGSSFLWTFRVTSAVQWINPAGGSWKTAANWSTGRVPGPTDIVRITLPGSYTVTLNGNTTVSSLRLGSSGTDPVLWINGSDAGSHTTLTVNGDLTSNGTIRLESRNAGYTSSLTVTQGTFVNQGVLEVNQGSGGARVVSANLRNQGTLRLNVSLTLDKDGGVYTNEGAITIAAGQQLVINGRNQVFDHHGGELFGPGLLVMTGATFVQSGGNAVEQPPLLRNSTVDFIDGGGGLATLIMTGGSGQVRGTLGSTHTLWIRGEDFGSHTTTNATNLTNGGLIRLESRNAGYESNLTGTVTNAPAGRIEVGLGSGGARRLNGTFLNQGLISMSFNATTAGTFTNQGQVEIAAGRSWTVNGAASVFQQNGGTIGGAGNLQIVSGTLSFNGGAFIGSAAILNDATFNFNGGTITGETAVLVNSRLNLAPSATGQASFAMSGPSGRITGNLLTGQTLWIRGQDFGSHTTVTAAGSFSSAGLIRLQSQNAGYESILAIPVGSLTNTGIIEINNGSGGTRRISGSVINQGLLDVNVGLSYVGTLTNASVIDIASGQKLSLSGSGQRFVQDGGTVTGAGVLEVTNGAVFTFNSGTTTGTLPVLVNANLAFGPSPSGASTVVMTGSGSVQGTLGAEQTLWISGRDQGSHTTITAAEGFVNQGTIRLESLNAGYESNLSGNFTNAPGGVITVNPGSGGGRKLSGTLSNLGTLDVNYDLTVNGTLNNHGTLDIDTGDRLIVAGTSSVLNMEAGAVTGNGSLQGVNSTFNLNAGTLAGGAPVITTSTVNFNGGVVTGAALQLVSSTLNLAPAATGAAAFTMSGPGLARGTLRPGQTLWVSGRDIGSHTTVTLADGFVNQGTIRLESQNAGYESSLAGNFSNDPGGVLEVRQGSGGSRRITGTLTNAGTINVIVGLTHIGVLRNQGTVNINAGQKLVLNGSAQELVQEGGTIAGSGVLELQAGAVLTFNSGTTTGSFPTLVNSTLAFGPSPSGSSTFVMTGSGLVRGTLGAGQTLWVSGRDQGSHTTITAAADFVNEGTLRLESQNAGYESSLTGDFVNGVGGVINVNAGSGGSRRITGALTNRGTLNVGFGLTLSKSGGTHTNLGTIDIASGQTLAVSGTTFVNSAGGTIRGRGVLNVSGVAFSNEGSINPGTSPGILTVSGSFPQAASGALNVEIGGLTAGSQFDRLDVSGAATFGGSLNVQIINGFTPALGNSFRILSCGSRSGTFAATNGLDLGNGLRLDPRYDATGLTLVVVASP
ncbi:MAG TPA: SdrD B-like domain-containing protein [Thermoanaerobaculia bacterium]|jgi:uncharacterized repeat protein (TIGR01451 family)|nr:SdrD B-like domain-containing protein [Thermoanaerobaculia bacterium]